MTYRVELIDSFLKVQREYLASVVWLSEESMGAMNRYFGTTDYSFRVTHDKWKSDYCRLRFKIEIDVYKDESRSFSVPVAEYPVYITAHPQDVQRTCEEALGEWLKARSDLSKELKLGSELILDGCVHPFEVDFVCDLGVFGRHDGLKGGEYEDYTWWESFSSIMGVLSEEELVE